MKTVKLLVINIQTMVLMEAFSRCATNTKLEEINSGFLLPKPIKEKFLAKILVNTKAKVTFRKV